MFDFEKELTEEMNKSGCFLAAVVALVILSIALVVVVY